jgi:uncharacterized protein
MLLPWTASALEVPVLSGRVNDYADMISPETERNLEEKLRAFEVSDSTQVVILTVNSLEGEALEEYSIRVAEKWKIGQARKDNGVLLLVSKNDRRMRIEVGRGLEGVLTDLLAGRILDSIITPRFKEGDFDRGFTNGTGAIIEACRGEFKADTVTPSDSDTNETVLYIIFFVIYFAIIITAAFSKILSGGIGAVALPAFVHFGIAPLGLIEAAVAAAAGFIIALILPYIPILAFIGGGSSGGNGGGGFSGGGGSFGGGGASGGW